MSDAAVLRVQRLRPGARLPERATPGATGYDLYACPDGEMVVGQEPALVPTGIAVEAPPGYDVQVRPRSGLSSKGVQVTFGTIDSDYRGEVLVTMYVLPLQGAARRPAGRPHRPAGHRSDGGRNDSGSRGAFGQRARLRRARLYRQLAVAVRQSSSRPHMNVR
jgi:hypothetical protein